jgi:stringent starvation protein B
VLVDAEVPGVVVPNEYVDDGKIVLNLSPAAVRNLSMDDQAVVCDSRFGGRPFALYLPMASLRAIYAKETGEGMRFEAESFPDPDPDGGPDDSGGKSSGPSHLKVVK